MVLIIQSLNRSSAAFTKSGDYEWTAARKGWRGQAGGGIQRSKPNPINRGRDMRSWSRHHQYNGIMSATGPQPVSLRGKCKQLHGRNAAWQQPKAPAVQGPGWLHAPLSPRLSHCCCCDVPHSTGYRWRTGALRPSLNDPTKPLCARNPWRC